MYIFQTFKIFSKSFTDLFKIFRDLDKAWIRACDLLVTKHLKSLILKLSKACCESFQKRESKAFKSVIRKLSKAWLQKLAEAC